MVVGVDTYHDPTRRGSSVAALCCSLNKNLTRYSSHVHLQVPATEMHSALCAMLFGITSSLTSFQITKCISF